jgi:MFS family permease
MPVYLRSIGFSILLIGVLEGFIEAIAGISKAFFGHWSDSKGRRMPFVQWGYFLSALSKPMLALFSAPLWVLFSRMVDRFGKGIRSAPRDALLSAESNSENKATVFGFHRSMDTVGAMLGPTAALVFLAFYPGHYKMLFILALLPGLLSVALTRLIKEPVLPVNPQHHLKISDIWRFRKKSGKNYKAITMRLLFFTVFNSSDVFLLLKIKDSGAHDSTVISLYIFFNLVYALLAFPLGKLADKLGVKRVLSMGFLMFAISYAGIALSSSLVYQVIFIAIYGIYAASTEGIAKAWIGQNSKIAEGGIAFGSFMAMQSLVIMLASFITAWIWTAYGSNYALLASSFGALLASIFVLSFQYRAERE